MSPFEIHPFEAWVKIGDTVADVHEGLNAGMRTIGVTKNGNELGLTEAEVARLATSDLRKRLDGIGKRLYEVGAHYVTEGIEGCPATIELINARLARGERP